MRKSITRLLLFAIALVTLIGLTVSIPVSAEAVTGTKTTKITATANSVNALTKSASLKYKNNLSSTMRKSLDAVGFCYYSVNDPENVITIQNTTKTKTYASFNMTIDSLLRDTDYMVYPYYDYQGERFIGEAVTFHVGGPNTTTKYVAVEAQQLSPEEATNMFEITISSVIRYKNESVGLCYYNNADPDTVITVDMGKRETDCYYVTLRDLTYYADYTVYPYFIYEGEMYKGEKVTFHMDYPDTHTDNISVKVKSVDSEAGTVCVSISNKKTTASEVGVCYYSQTDPDRIHSVKYKYSDSKSFSLTLENMIENPEYTVYPYYVYRGITYTGEAISVQVDTAAYFSADNTTTTKKAIISQEETEYTTGSVTFAFTNDFVKQLTAKNKQLVGIVGIGYYPKTESEKICFVQYTGAVTDTSFSMTVDNLENRDYVVFPFFTYNGKKYIGEEITVRLGYVSKITNDAVSEIKTKSATFSLDYETVGDCEIYSSGFCYGTGDEKETRVSCDSGESKKVTGLISGTEYWYYAYTKTRGGQILYGEKKTFTTIDIPVTSIAIDYYEKSSKDTKITANLYDRIEYDVELTPKSAEKCKLKWSSSDESIVKLDGYTIYACGSGVATITVTSADGTVSDSVKVRVRRTTAYEGAPVLRSVTEVDEENVALEWTAPSSFDEMDKCIYFVYRATDPNGPYKRMELTTDTSTVDDDVELGETYYYKIIAYDKDKDFSGDFYKWEGTDFSAVKPITIVEKEDEEDEEEQQDDQTPTTGTTPIVRGLKDAYTICVGDPLQLNFSVADAKGGTVEKITVKENKTETDFVKSVTPGERGTYLWTQSIDGFDAVGEYSFCVYARTENYQTSDNLVGTFTVTVVDEKTPIVKGLEENYTILVGEDLDLEFSVADANGENVETITVKENKTVTDFEKSVEVGTAGTYTWKESFEDFDKAGVYTFCVYARTKNYQTSNNLVGMFTVTVVEETKPVVEGLKSGYTISVGDPLKLKFKVTDYYGGIVNRITVKENAQETDFVKTADVNAEGTYTWNQSFTGFDTAGVYNFCVYAKTRYFQTSDNLIGEFTVTVVEKTDDTTDSADDTSSVRVLSANVYNNANGYTYNSKNPLQLFDGDNNYQNGYTLTVTSSAESDWYVYTANTSVATAYMKNGLLYVHAWDAGTTQLLISNQYAADLSELGNDAVRYVVCDITVCTSKVTNTENGHTYNSENPLKLFAEDHNYQNGYTLTVTSSAESDWYAYTADTSVATAYMKNGLLYVHALKAGTTQLIISNQYAADLSELGNGAIRHAVCDITVCTNVEIQPDDDVKLSAISGFSADKFKILYGEDRKEVPANCYTVENKNDVLTVKPNGLWTPNRSFYCSYDGEAIYAFDSSNEYQSRLAGKSIIALDDYIIKPKITVNKDELFYVSVKSDQSFTKCYNVVIYSDESSEDVGDDLALYVNNKTVYLFGKIRESESEFGIGLKYKSSVAYPTITITAPESFTKKGDDIEITNKCHVEIYMDDQDKELSDDIIQRIRYGISTGYQEVCAMYGSKLAKQLNNSLPEKIYVLILENATGKNYIAGTYFNNTDIIAINSSIPSDYEYCYSDFVSHEFQHLCFYKLIVKKGTKGDTFINEVFSERCCYLTVQCLKEFSDGADKNYKHNRSNVLGKIKANSSTYIYSDSDSSGKEKLLELIKDSNPSVENYYLYSSFGFFLGYCTTERTGINFVLNGGYATLAENLIAERENTTNTLVATYRALYRSGTGKTTFTDDDAETYFEGTIIPAYRNYLNLCIEQNQMLE